MGNPNALEQFQQHFLQTYAPFAHPLVRGEGSWLWDDDGKRYLDFCGGIAVSNVGHCHPAVVEAIREQAGRLMHISNLYLHPLELTLAERLMEHAFPGRLFLCQSGAEANEAAFKLARRYARTVLKEDRWKIITARNSFHGRTLAAIAATGQEKYQKGYEPLPAGFIHVPYDDLQALAAAIDKQTAAVLLEPIQGEGGVVLPRDGYFREVSALCKERNVLLMLDEVQTGFGRTGSFFAYQQEEIHPDVITMAKAFGGGLPLGGILARPHLSAFVPGDHATTFGGNPVCCAAALAVIDVMEKEKLVENARVAGGKLVAALRDLHAEFPGMIREIRGRGLLIGIDLSMEGALVLNACREAGLLVSIVQARTIRLSPPLTIGAEEIATAVEILRRVLRSLSGSCSV